MSLGPFTRRSILSAAAALAATPAVIAPARAQSDFPSRPIHLVVGFAAGGGNDIFARLVGAKLSEILGQPVIVENKPGAGGRLAPEYVTQQAADGYTLFVGPSGAMAVAAAIYPDLKYSPTKSFVPLAMIANFPLILVVAADNPANNVKDFVAWMKAHPDKANYASSSPAFTITTELLKLKTGMPGTMIPYKGSGEMILSVIQGQTAMTIADGPPTIPQVKGGKVKALAVTGTAAFAAFARRAEHGGGRLSERRRPPLERRVRADRHAGAGHRQAAKGVEPVDRKTLAYRRNSRPWRSSRAAPRRISSKRSSKATPPNSATWSKRRI